MKNLGHSIIKSSELGFKSMININFIIVGGPEKDYI